MTVSIAWMTPFDAFTSATITFEVPFSVSFPALRESVIASPCTVFTDALFFAAATAAVLGTFLASTWYVSTFVSSALSLVDGSERVRRRALQLREGGVGGCEDRERALAAQRLG